MSRWVDLTSCLLKANCKNSAGSINWSQNWTFVPDLLNDDVGSFGRLAFAGSGTSEVVDYHRGPP